MSIEPIPVNRTEQVEILKAMGLDPRLPMTKAVVLICERYGLDPILGHAIIVQNKPFLTHQGLLHIAHKSGQFDGISTTVEKQGNEWVATATVYRKDMRMPFTYQGFARVDERNARDMAMIRAERRCLKRAFNVNVPIQGEEPGEDVDVAPDPIMPDDRPPLPEVAASIPVSERAMAEPTPLPVNPAPPPGVDPATGEVPRPKGAAATPTSPTTPPSSAAQPAGTGASTPGAVPASDDDAATAMMKLAVARAKRLAIAANKAGVDEMLQDQLIEMVTHGRTNSRKEVDESEEASLLRVYELIRDDKLELRYDEEGQLVEFEPPVNWKHLAKVINLREVQLLKKARELAEELACPLPSSIADIYDDELEAALFEWLDEADPAWRERV